MVLNEIKENVSGNLGESTSFTIEANEAAFQILTDKLYKYRIRAIVRELAANAIDANRVLKTNLNNWEITLPNSINPTFAIEDFGIGMTDKEIKEIYTTFFKSTKSSSNDQTGMFGLGSKTPFAYTKQFIVESSKDGFKNIYSMHSENGKPEVIKVNPEPIPTNKTGTKVSFAVNNGDFREFYDAMIYSSAVWPGLPKINGASEFYSYLKNKKWDSDAEPEVILENTNKIYSSMEKIPATNDFIKVGNDKFYLEMGNVLYYVSLEQLDYNPIFSNVLGSYIIHAPIGAVSITPNREDLQYDEKTKEFLNKEIISTIIKNFEFNFNCYKDDAFLKIINTEESKLTSEGKKALKVLIKKYKELGKIINNIDKQISSKELFVVKSFDLKNSSKNLTSAWRPLSYIFEATVDAGYSFLYHLETRKGANIKLFELKEGEYNRYKISEGALTGFFNSRLNRINRDLFAKANNRNEASDSEVTRYGAESISTPIYLFCKEGKADFIKSLYPALEKAEVLKDFSWEVLPGEHWFIRGPNGSGKTTLLELITGDNKQVFCNDVWLFGQKRGTGESIWDIKKNLGIVSYRLHVEYRMLGGTELENVIISGFHDSIGLYEKKTDMEIAAAKKWLKLAGFEGREHESFGNLSYGEQRAILIIRAAVKSPKIMILDEPCHGLDEQYRQKILDLLETVANSGTTTLLHVTHDPTEVLEAEKHILELCPGEKPMYKIIVKE